MVGLPIAELTILGAATLLVAHLSKADHHRMAISKAGAKESAFAEW